MFTFHNILTLKSFRSEFPALPVSQHFSPFHAAYPKKKHFRSSVCYTIQFTHLLIKYISMSELKIEKKKRFPVIWMILGIIAIAVIVWIIVDDNDNNTDVMGENETELNEPYENENGFAESEEWNGNEVWGDDSDVPESDSGLNNNDTEVWGDDSDAGETRRDIRQEDDSNTFGGDYSGALGTDANAPDDVMRSNRIQNFISFAEQTNESNLNRRRTHEGINKLAMALSAVTTDSTGTSMQQELNRLKQQADQLKDNRLSNQQASIIKSSFMDAANIIQMQSRNYDGMDNEASQVMEAARRINEQDMASNQKAAIQSFFTEAADALEKMKNSDLNDNSTGFRN